MKPVFFLLAFLQVNYANAQHSLIKIHDKETGAAIPYATIKILHSSKGVIASDKGTFELSVESIDTVQITSIGYKKKLLTGKDMLADIFMEPLAVALKDISVTFKKPFRKIILGNGAPFINEKIDCAFSYLSHEGDCWNWGPSPNKDEFAEKVTLPDTSSIFKIGKIFIPLKKGGCWGTLILHIYEEDSTGRYPGEEIFLKPLHFTKKDITKGKLAIDVNTDNIYLHNNKAFFIGISWMEGASKEQCISTIILKKLSQENTYSRTLSSTTYDWFPFGKSANEKKETGNMNTMFAVELLELK